MGSFLKSASRPAPDARAFLREASGGNGIKYSAEKGARHIIYIPFTQQEVVDEESGNQSVVKALVAISGAVHEWTTSDDKFKATICLKDIIRKSDDGQTVINDGHCPFCDRVSDGWEIYNYRKDLEEATCKLTGQQREKHLETVKTSFRDERKAKEVRNYMYILVAKFKTSDNGKEVIGDDGLPEYELKVMKLSSSRVEKIQQQILNSGSELPGSELIFEYPNVEDRRLLVSQSTTTPVFPNNMLTARYPKLLDKINKDISKFEWDGIEKAFPEWVGMSSSEADMTIAALFEQWDAYKKERLVDPNAKYLEYVVRTPATTPNLNGADGGVVPAVPTLPNVPTVPNVPNVPTVPNVAAAASNSAGVAVPNIPIPGQSVSGQIPAPVVVGSETAPTAPNVPSVNDVFANGASAPKINV